MPTRISVEMTETEYIVCSLASQPQLHTLGGGVENRQFSRIYGKTPIVTVTYCNQLRNLHF